MFCIVCGFRFAYLLDVFLAYVLNVVHNIGGCRCYVVCTMCFVFSCGCHVVEVSLCSFVVEMSAASS